jgi:hypothetical protein
LLGSVLASPRTAGTEALVLPPHPTVAFVTTGEEEDAVLTDQMSRSNLIGAASSVAAAPGSELRQPPALAMGIEG